MGHSVTTATTCCRAGGRGRGWREGAEFPPSSRPRYLPLEHGSQRVEVRHVGNLDKVGAKRASMSALAGIAHATTQAAEALHDTRRVEVEPAELHPDEPLRSGSSHARRHNLSCCPRPRGALGCGSQSLQRKKHGRKCACTAVGQDDRRVVINSSGVPRGKRVPAAAPNKGPYSRRSGKRFTVLHQCSCARVIAPKQGLGDSTRRPAPRVLQKLSEARRCVSSAKLNRRHAGNAAVGKSGGSKRSAERRTANDAKRPGRAAIRCARSRCSVRAEQR